MWKFESYQTTIGTEAAREVEEKAFERKDAATEMHEKFDEE